MIKSFLLRCTIEYYEKNIHAGSLIKRTEASLVHNAYIAVATKMRESQSRYYRHLQPYQFRLEVCFEYMLWTDYPFTKLLMAAVIPSAARILAHSRAQKPALSIPADCSLANQLPEVTNLPKNRLCAQAANEPGSYGLS